MADIIRTRNEGAKYYDQLIREHGLEAARKMLNSRITSRVSIAIPQKEFMESAKNLDEAMSNVYLVTVYTTLHDAFGFGETRLKRFKDAFDLLMATCYAQDELGAEYITLTSCAEDMEKLYGMGIQIDKVTDRERLIKDDEKIAKLSGILGFLRHKGYTKAADAVWEEVNERDSAVSKERTKEQRQIAKERRRQDMKYRSPNMNLFDPEVNVGYLAVFATALMREGFSDAQICDLCAEVNDLLGEVLSGGREYEKGLISSLAEHGIEFDQED